MKLSPKINEIKKNKQEYLNRNQYSDTSGQTVILTVNCELYAAHPCWVLIVCVKEGIRFSAMESPNKSLSA